MPHVSPLKGPSRSFEFKEKKMEDEEMLRSVAKDRLTPRMFFICDKNLCYPIDATFAHYDVGQRLGIMDVCAMENDEFTNPCAADMVRDICRLLRGVCVLKSRVFGEKCHAVSSIHRKW